MLARTKENATILFKAQYSQAKFHFYYLHVHVCIFKLSLLAIIYGSLTTCRQVDLKRIIAYSSVAHMGLVTLSLFSHTVQDLVAAIFLMLAQGLVSSALFIAVILEWQHSLKRQVNGV